MSYIVLDGKTHMHKNHCRVWNLNFSSSCLYRLALQEVQLSTIPCNVKWKQHVKDRIISSNKNKNRLLSKYYCLIIVS
jgi:hypothetical protein